MSIANLFQPNELTLFCDNLNVAGTLTAGDISIDNTTIYGTLTFGATSTADFLEGSIITGNVVYDQNTNAIYDIGSNLTLAGAVTYGDASVSTYPNGSVVNENGITNYQALSVVNVSGAVNYAANSVSTYAPLAIIAGNPTITGFPVFPRTFVTPGLGAGSLHATYGPTGTGSAADPAVGNMTLVRMGQVVYVEFPPLTITNGVTTQGYFAIPFSCFPAGYTPNVSLSPTTCIVVSDNGEVPPVSTNGLGYIYVNTGAAQQVEIRCNFLNLPAGASSYYFNGTAGQQQATSQAGIATGFWYLTL